MDGITTPRTARGDADIAAVAGLFADPTRARVLLALADGRSLPASVLADEAGVSPQAASTQLKRLMSGGLITGERSGRHRYYRLASERVAALLETLAAVAPGRPVRSLREHTRAAALRRARTCYDHLAGRLGCAITQAFVDRRAIVAVDGIADTRRRPGDPIAAVLPDHPYQAGPGLPALLAVLGIDPDRLAGPGRRPLLRFCLDWSEQRHHLGGRLGAVLLDHAEHAGWITRGRGDRAVSVTDRGRRELADRLDVPPDGG
ncbi:MAG TPA: winged helix-turn-helix domain-containing protein [Pseudonocardiaceae bacterium]|jgi:DNA-binding transcriptional ArsR family regulator|nr:winged helix-turn-helix domain-containing protein [Pseudonocardiaceae bacterium]